MKLTPLWITCTAALLAMLLPLTGHAQAAVQADLLPIQEPDLQRGLNRIVEKNGWGPMIDLSSLAIALVVLDDQGGYRLAMLNGHQMIYAASLPKIAILFAAMVEVQEGDLVLDEAAEEDLNNMIRVSCNPCATRSMERVGRDKLLQILQRPEFEFYNEDRFGGLWVGKDYGKKPAHKRDPIKGLSHGATAFQVARIYYRLSVGSLLDAEHTAMMTDIMSRPGIAHKFVKGLEQEEGIEMLRKSGSWKNFHADSAMVTSAAGRYILVGLVEGSNGEKLLQALARDAHQLVEEL
jgi:beta-lactamase class A